MNKITDKFTYSLKNIILIFSIILGSIFLIFSTELNNLNSEDKFEIKFEKNEVKNLILLFNETLIESKSINHSINKSMIKTNKDAILIHNESVDKIKNILENQNDNLSTFNISELTNVFSGVSISQVSKDTYQTIVKEFPDIIIEEDIPMSILVSNVTKDLLQLQEVYSIQINNSNLTGKGVNIAVLDTGIDPTHPDFGTCLGFTNEIEYFTSFNSINYSLESNHPYSNDLEITSIINLTNYSNISKFSLFFSRYSIENNFDYLEIYNSNNTLIQNITGEGENVSSNIINGNYAKLKFKTDYSVTSYGYSISSILYGNEIQNSSCDKITEFYDFAYDNNYPYDGDGHGTHVASTISSNNSNYNLKGIAPNSNLYIYKVLGDSGTGFTSDVLQGIDRALDPNLDGNFSDMADIISMSLGASTNDPNYITSIAIDNIAKLGVVPIIAAGNSGPNRETLGSPGTSREAITIGASFKRNESFSYQNGEVDDIVFFSSRGPTDIGTIKPDIVAPGVKICAALGNGTFGGSSCEGSNIHHSISGTSMATPIVSGVVALLKQANPNLTPKEIKNILKVSSKDLNLPVNVQGRGRIQPIEAIKYINNPPCNVEFNTTTLNSNTISTQNYSIQGFISCSNFSYYELSSSILNSDFSINETTLILNESNQGVINLSFNFPYFVPEEILLTLKAYDTNSSLNNFDMLYINSLYQDNSILNNSISTCGIISIPGNYYLENNISTEQFNCIKILVNNVELNCNLNSITASHHGIITNNVRNLSIQNCNIDNSLYINSSQNIILNNLSINNLLIQNSSAPLELINSSIQDIEIKDISSCILNTKNVKYKDKFKFIFTDSAGDIFDLGSYLNNITIYLCDYSSYFNKYEFNNSNLIINYMNNYGLYLPNNNNSNISIYNSKDINMLINLDNNLTNLSFYNSTNNTILNSKINLDFIYFQNSTNNYIFNNTISYNINKNYSILKDNYFNTSYSNSSIYFGNYWIGFECNLVKEIYAFWKYYICINPSNLTLNKNITDFAPLVESFKVPYLEFSNFDAQTNFTSLNKAIPIELQFNNSKVSSVIILNVNNNKTYDLSPFIFNNSINTILPIEYENNSLEITYTSEFGIEKKINYSVLINKLIVGTPGDLDGDLINDSLDTIIGNTSNIISNIENLSLSINNSQNLSQIFNSTLNLIFRKDDIPLIEFENNFSSNNLNLTLIGIRKSNQTNNSKLIISGLELEENTTKTVYLELSGNISQFGSICIKDAKIEDFSQISNNCSGLNETYVQTIPSTINDYTFEFENNSNLTNPLVKITGLIHSGITQSCTEDWQYSSWSTCSSGTQTRNAVDNNNCGSSHTLEELSQSCSSTSPSSGSSSGGGGGGGGSSSKKSIAEIPKIVNNKTENNNSFMTILNNSIDEEDSKVLVLDNEIIKNDTEIQIEESTPQFDDSDLQINLDTNSNYESKESMLFSNKTFGVNNLVLFSIGFIILIIVIVILIKMLPKSNKYK